MLRRARRDPCLGRVIQQSLGRAAVAGALPGHGAFCDLRDRHESRGRNRAAGQDGAAAGRHHHHGRAGASGVLCRHRGDRRRQGGNLRRRWSPAAPWCSTATIRSSRGCSGAPRSSASRASSRSAPTAKSDARLIDVSLHAACSAVHANILGHDVTYKLGMPGRHMAMNSLAVLAAASLAGADLALAALVAVADRAGRRAAACGARWKSPAARRR